jgi:hypothetical protein
MTGNTNTATDFRNTILNGDSVQLMRALPRNSVDFILTDPPYLVNYQGRDGRKVAAYNAGPGRYDDHLATGRPLPTETISYVEFVTRLMKNPSSDIHLPFSFSPFPARSWVTAGLFVSGQPYAFRAPTARHVAVPENLFAGHAGESSDMVPLRGSDQVQ